MREISDSASRTPAAPLSRSRYTGIVGFGHPVKGAESGRRQCAEDKGLVAVRPGDRTNGRRPLEEQTNTTPREVMK